MCGGGGGVQPYNLVKCKTCIVNLHNTLMYKMPLV